MIEIPSQIDPEIKPVLFSVLAWQSYHFGFGAITLCIAGYCRCSRKGNKFGVLVLKMQIEVVMRSYSQNLRRQPN